MKSSDLFTTGGGLLLIGLVSILQAFFVIPLPIMPRVLNFLIRDYRDEEFTYTKQDVEDSPWVYSLLGWLMVYLIVAFISPVFLLGQTLGTNLTFLTATIVLGLFIWFMLLCYSVIYISSIVKALTNGMRKLWKYFLGLWSPKLTDLEPTVHTSEHCSI